MILSFWILIPVALGSAIMFVDGIPYIAPTHSSAVIRSADSDTAFATFCCTAFAFALTAASFDGVEGVG